MLIIADDLTGACDAAGPFAARGAHCLVSLWNKPLPRGEVVSISTESRDASEADIVHRIKSVATVAAHDVIFKKIDSTLRGNVRLEIEAAKEAFGFTGEVVTPAFPDMGRMVRDGCLYVHDRHHPHAGLSLLDASCNEDLDAIVAEHLSRTVLWAGSAGLASALARRIYGPMKACSAPSLAKPLVFCIGTDHSVTKRQMEELNGQYVFQIVRGRTSPGEIRQALDCAGAFCVSGGDTASMVLSALGADGIDVKGEVVTGVPWGLLLGGEMNGLPVVTKSGGFGAPDTLVRVAEFFHT